MFILKNRHMTLFYVSCLIFIFVCSCDQGNIREKKWYEYLKQAFAFKVAEIRENRFDFPIACRKNGVRAHLKYFMKCAIQQNFYQNYSPWNVYSGILRHFHLYDRQNNMLCLQWLVHSSSINCTIKLKTSAAHLTSIGYKIGFRFGLAM